MWCFRAKRWISAYLDGELGRSRRAALEEHLGRCNDCAAELVRLRAQWVALSDVGDAPPLPTGLWSLVVRELDGAERRPWYRRQREGLIRAAAVIAFVLLGFASGALLSWREPTDHGGQPQCSLSEESLFAEAFDTPVFVLGEEEEGRSRCDPE